MGDNPGEDNAISSSGFRSIIRGVMLLSLVLLFGTLGYMRIEGWPLLEGLYMTVITITTVGYGEVRTVSEPGRVFTVFLIFAGMGIMAYTLGIVAQIMVEFQVRDLIGRRRLGLKLKNMKNHYIVCGYGRIGSIIAQELKSNGIPLIVVDQNSQFKEKLRSRNIPYIIDDATSEDVLVEAGILRAKGLVTVVLSDADNLFITMTARGINPDLFILARADQETSEKKLIRAGADKVVMPYLIGGLRMVHMILKPAVTDFFNFAMHDKTIELEMEELKVGEKSVLNGVRLMDAGIRQDMNVMIVAIRDKAGVMSFNPSSDVAMEAGATLIALGRNADLEKLGRILSGG